MTPTPWDVLTDKYNGLRTMADETNRQVSLWYDREWGADANIVAVDYVRGTTLMESSLRWNRMRCAVAVVPKVNESE